MSSDSALTGALVLGAGLMCAAVGYAGWGIIGAVGCLGAGLVATVIALVVIAAA